MDFFRNALKLAVKLAVNCKSNLSFPVFLKFLFVLFALEDQVIHEKYIFFLFGNDCFTLSSSSYSLITRLSLSSIQ